MKTHPDPLPIGAAAPDFALPDAYGARVSLADLAGSALVYVQACNHCPYVVANVARLVALARRFQDQGVRFVFVNSNDADAYPDDAPEAMRHFAEEHSLPFPYLVDAEQSTAVAYRTQRTPEVLLFDADRRLRYHGQVDDSPKDPDAVRETTLADAILAVLNGEEVRHPETFAMGCTVKWKPDNFPEIG